LKHSQKVQAKFFRKFLADFIEELGAGLEKHGKT